MRLLTVQVANCADGSYDVHKPLPYPWHVRENGDVMRQEFWKGRPDRLIAFQPDPKPDMATMILFPDPGGEPLVPAAVIGWYPAFVDGDGEMWNATMPITSCEWTDDPGK